MSMRLLILTLVAFASGCATAGPEPVTVTPLRAAEMPVAQTKLQLVRKAWQLAKDLRRSGQGDEAALARWSVRLRDAEMEVAADKGGRVAAAASYMERMKDLEARAQSLYDNGQSTFMGVLEARYELMQAEEFLAKVKAE